MRNTIDDVGIVSPELPQDFHTLRAATKESDHHQNFLQPRTFLPLPPSAPLSCGNISTQLYFIIRFLHQINDCPGSGWIFNIYMLGSRVCIIPYIILYVMYTTHTISFHHNND